MPTHTRLLVFLLSLVVAVAASTADASAAQSVSVTTRADVSGYMPNLTVPVVVTARNTSATPLGANARVCVAKPRASSGARVWSVARGVQDLGNRLCLPLAGLTGSQLWGLSVKIGASTHGDLRLAVTVEGARLAKPASVVLREGGKALALSAGALRSSRELRVVARTSNYTYDPSYLGEVCVRVSGRGARLVVPSRGYRASGAVCWSEGLLNPGGTRTKTLRVKTTKATRSVVVTLSAPEHKTATLRLKARK